MSLDEAARRYSEHHDRAATFANEKEEISKDKIIRARKKAVGSFLV